MTIAVGSVSVARTAEEAAGKFVASVLRDRRRYGGNNWRPREEAPV